MVNNKPKNSVRIETVCQSKTLRFLSIWILLATCLLPVDLFAQTEPSALFEIQSTDKGFLLPRMTEAQRDAIVNPAKGLVIYNTTTDCADINFGTPTAPLWHALSCRPGTISTLNCIGATVMGTLVAGKPVPGISVIVPYTGGTGGTQSGQTVTSTGVEGLTATLAAGNFSNGADNLIYFITGIPTETGIASILLRIGGQSCTLPLPVLPGSIGSLDCNNSAMIGSLMAGVAANGVSVKVPYTGGNGGLHGVQVLTSTGVTGLTAMLAAGTFAVGADSLTYTITGIPSSVGTANFVLNIGEQSCTLSQPVWSGLSGSECWAKVSATDTLFFMCHNLASANTTADPLTPSWEVIGGYWQWGWKGPSSSQWLNTNTENFAHGPTGPGSSQANEGDISGWSQTNASNGSWLDGVKTANDLCPAGFRLPTKTQWDSVNTYNSQIIVGTWHSSAMNYSSGHFFGPSLMLPSAGIAFNTAAI